MDPLGGCWGGGGTAQGRCGGFGHLGEGLPSTQPPFLLGDLLGVVLMVKKTPLWKRTGSPPSLSPWQLGHAQVTWAQPTRCARVQSGLWTREAGLGFSGRLRRCCPEAAAAVCRGRVSWRQGRGLEQDTGLSHAWPPRRPHSVSTGPYITLCPRWRTRLCLCCLQLGILTHGEWSLHSRPEAAHPEVP